MSLVDTKMTMQAYMAFSTLPNTKAETATTTPSTASISLPMERWGSRRPSSRATRSLPPVVAPRMKMRERPRPSSRPANRATKMGSPW